MRIGIAGFGFMGRMHLANWNRCAGAEVVAVCEQNPEMIKTLDQPVGNLAGAAQSIDLKRITPYSDLGEMLKNERIDAVSITLPTHLHAATSIECLNTGVHVLCEKPMALNSADCDRMIAAAEASGKQLIIAHCIRFWPEYAMAKSLIESGEYGRVVSATFNRIGTAPAWSSGGWLSDPERSGGITLDLHIHDTDYILSLFGKPTSVCAHAGSMNGQMMHIHTHYNYGDECVIMSQGSWAASPTYPFEMSFTIMFEKATLVYNCNVTPTLNIYTGQGQPYAPEVGEGDGYMREIAWFSALLGGETVPPVTSAAQSRESVHLIEAERISALEQRRVQL